MKKTKDITITRDQAETIVNEKMALAQLLRDKKRQLGLIEFRKWVLLETTMSVKMADDLLMWSIFVSDNFTRKGRVKRCTA